MHFHILTLFPEMVMDGLGTSITGRAMKKGTISVDAINIRDYAQNKHGQVDDYPYGGGAGMVMQPGPVYRAYEAVKEQIEERKKLQCTVLDENETVEDTTADKGRRLRVVYMTPQGKVFNQEIARELAQEEDLVLLCGHYEGIDERVLERIVTDNISIGDYVLTGGELPAMVVIDAVSRMVPGVLHNDVSAEFETFHENLLEYPQYTRPEEFMGERVPDVLLSGHHKNIEAWRREQSIARTKERRPDLWEKNQQANS
ncbi:MAG: tRNA (guanosine(37)-N1)-methyltransferase TrmD [Lachnospiraceae bacterium]|nr:tRNA (guanosine(37)-N1)-methyltransferase TrmD [Lachnospiraceae bacterium]HCJ07501.1 tRNA (guanosine(37)-N1)-methyltransferase TrmD [Lachnospiraceae bacterium]